MKTHFDGFDNIEDIKRSFSDESSGNWDNETNKYVENPNRGSDVDLSNIDWIFAVYTSWSYEGSAFILFKQNGQIYEVNGGHCSCYGLEGQWTPEATTLEAIQDRLNNGLGKDYHDEDNYNKELANFIKEIENG